MATLQIYIDDEDSRTISSTNKHRANTRDQFRAADTQVFCCTERKIRDLSVSILRSSTFSRTYCNRLFFSFLSIRVSKRASRAHENKFIIFIHNFTAKSRAFGFFLSDFLSLSPYTHVVVVASFFKNISYDLTGWNVGRALWRSPIFTFFPI